MLVYKPVASNPDKIKNKYRWRIIIKCRVNSKVLDIIQYGIKDETIEKMKDISIAVDINPNNLT